MGATLERKLTTHTERLAEFLEAKSKFQKAIKNFTASTFDDPSKIDDTYETFSTALKGLPGQDETLQQEINIELSEIQNVISNH